MDKDSALLPVIPASTVRAARELYGQGNVYLRLGDRLNTLVSKFDQRTLSVPWREPTTLLLALLTIIQYVEKLTDAELAASIQHRMDLCYALHLATPSPRLDPHILCAFRSRLLAHPPSWGAFEEIFHSVYPELTCNAIGEEPTIDDVLNSICENEVRVSLIEAMFGSMEALSANHSNWLRKIALPHWYQRYNRSLVGTHFSTSVGKQELTREDVQGDVQHLLDEIHESNSPDILAMYEIQDLHLTFQQLTHSKSKRDCDHCIRKNH